MKSESVRINGIDIFYEMEGSGEPLLLLHGGTGCHENWIHAGGETLAHEYTLIKPDARGHGRTNNP
jgi:2-succinyl-6-hydroxy-2,4-cyclohexadiene-1-carboxylate synthase